MTLTKWIPATWVVAAFMSAHVSALVCLEQAPAAERSAEERPA